MPRLTDLNLIHTLLNRDRVWAAYAIGDLSPALVDYCDWHGAADSTAALLLLFRGLDPPILFAMGRAADLAGLCHEIDAPQVALHVPEDALSAIGGTYTPAFTRRMRRMALAPDRFAPVEHHQVRAVAPHDLDAVTALFADGYRRGEGPTAFMPSMLDQGTYRGIWEDDALVAIAGTHLFAPEMGVCAIGNVYTRGDRRGRGLGARVTSAVAAHALAHRLPTIILSVGGDNLTAFRVYQRLGFSYHCHFVEGEATRRQPPVMAPRT